MPVPVTGQVLNVTGTGATGVTTAIAGRAVPQYEESKRRKSESAAAVYIGLAGGVTVSTGHQLDPGTTFGYEKNLAAWADKVTGISVGEICLWLAQPRTRSHGSRPLRRKAK